MDSDLYGGPQGAAPESFRPPAHACPPTANWQGQPPGSSLALVPLPQGSISQAWQIPLPARTPSGHQLSQALFGKNSSRLAPQQLKSFSARPGTQKNPGLGGQGGVGREPTRVLPKLGERHEGKSAENGLESAPKLHHSMGVILLAVFWG